MNSSILLHRLGMNPENFKEKDVEMVRNGDNDFVYYVEEDTTKPECPFCHQKEKVIIHDYYNKMINISLNMHISEHLLIKRVRFKCKQCNKSFTNKIDGIDQKKTIPDIQIELLRRSFMINQTFQDIADTYHLSLSKTLDLFDEIFPKVNGGRLPKFLCIDEVFFDRTADCKFCCVISDFKTREVVDILPSRRKDYLIKYFIVKNQKELNNVEVFISDMNDTYRYIRNRFFKNAIHVIDRFHIIKLLTTAVNALRIRTMNRYGYDNIYHSFMIHRWEQFLKRRRDVFDGFYSHTKTNVSMHYDDIIFECIKLDQSFWEGYNILQEMYELKNYTTYKEASEYIEYLAERLDLTGNELLIKTAKSLRKWKTGIGNAYCINKWNIRFHNGVAEGNNNTIKTVQKSAYGYHNFERFRKRVLLILSAKNKE